MFSPYKRGGGVKIFTLTLGGGGGAQKVSDPRFSHFVDPLPGINPLDPRDLPYTMRYFLRISPNSLKISTTFRANIQTQIPTYAYLFIKTK